MRPLTREDFAGLYGAASAPEVWAGHPAKDRYKKEVFQRYFDFLLDTRTALAVVKRESDEIIGCSRYYFAQDHPEHIAIGFTFLSQLYWGGSTNLELKRLMLDHAFKTFPVVWFHIDPTNLRSQKATIKLGAEFVCDTMLDLSGTSARWMCFKLAKTTWDITEALSR